MSMDLITNRDVLPLRLQQPITLTRSPDSHPKRVFQNTPHAPPLPTVVSYKECLKNHAATIGGHALDGCCEFMPGPTASFSDPTSLTCAACGCHRNFHRRDPDDPAPLHHHPPARRPHSPPSASQLLLSLSRPSDDIKTHPTAAIVGYQNGGQNGNRKRFRTRFSQEQKEKMYEFSEKIGWKLRKGEDKLVADFCKEIGVVRGVFKVWMHNNKHSSTTFDHNNAQYNPRNGNNNNNNNNNNGGSCSSVIDHHPFYNATNGAQQEAQ